MKRIFILPTQLKINTTSGVEELLLHGEGSFDEEISFDMCTCEDIHIQNTPLSLVHYTGWHKPY